MLRRLLTNSLLVICWIQLLILSEKCLSFPTMFHSVSSRSTGFHITSPSASMSSPSSSSSASSSSSLPLLVSSVSFHSSRLFRTTLLYSTNTAEYMNEFPMTEQTFTILQNQLQLAVTATKSIYGEIHLFGNDKIDQSLKLSLLCGYEIPESPVNGTTMESSLLSSLEEANDHNAMVLEGQNLIIPLSDQMYAFGYLYLQRAKGKRRGSRQAWDEAAISHAQIAAQSITHLINLEGMYGNEYPEEEEEETPQIQEEPQIFGRIDDAYLKLHPVAYENTKRSIAFVRSFVKSLRLRLPKNDEMGHEMIDTINDQLTSADENLKYATYVPEELQEMATPVISLTAFKQTF